MSLIVLVTSSGEAAKKPGGAGPKAGKLAPKTGEIAGAADSERNGLQMEIEIASKFFSVTPESLQKLKGNLPQSGEGSVHGVFSDEAWVKWSEAAMREEGVDVLSSPGTKVRFGQNAMVEVVREFQYPTDWARNAKKGVWEPRKFATQPVGIRMGVFASQGADGFLELTLEPEINEFQGWINLEDKTQVSGTKAGPGATKLDQLLHIQTPENAAGKRLQPVFSRRKISVPLRVTSGQTALLTLAAQEPGEAPILVAVTSRVLKPIADVSSVAVIADTLAYDAEKGTITAEGSVEVETPNSVLRSARLELRARKPAVAALPSKEPTEKTVEVPPGDAFKLSGPAAEKIGLILVGPVKFQEKPLGEVLAELHRMSIPRSATEEEGLHFVLELPDGAPEPKVTVDLENATLLEAVEAVARAVGLRVTAEPSGFHFGPPRSAVP